MKPREANLSIEFLRDVLSYEPTTGIFFCKKKYAKKILVGSIVGANHLAGYKHIMLQRTQFLAHRLAWFYVYGCWPNMEIDHIDGNRSNNAISNLRDVDRLTNAQNKTRPQSNNLSGFLGVHAKRGRWVADIKAKGKTVRVGTFDTPTEASEAFLNAKRKHHAGCTI